MLFRIVSKAHRVIAIVLAGSLLANPPPERPPAHKPARFGDTSMLTESLIEQLEGTPEARQTAIDGLVRLGSERDSSTEYREVEIALNRAFDAPEAERSLHRRMSIIKIMVHLFSPRAITMVNEAYAHGDRQLADMFRAGVTLANLEKISWPSDDELRNTEIQLSLMGNIGAKYLVETKRPAGETLYRSHDHLRAARPEEADFYMMMHYLAIAATVQTRLDLFDG